MCMNQFDMFLEHWKKWCPMTIDSFEEFNSLSTGIPKQVIFSVNELYLKSKNSLPSIDCFDALKSLLKTFNWILESVKIELKSIWKPIIIHPILNLHSRFLNLLW